MRQIVLAVLLTAVAAASPSILLAAPQDKDPKAEARQLLLEASQLIKDIPESQQLGAIANLACTLAVAGDLPKALELARHLKKPKDRAYVARTIAWELAHTGNLAQALDVIETSVDGDEKLIAYGTISAQLAGRGDPQQALEIVHRIRTDPYMLVGSLLDVAVRLGKNRDLLSAKLVVREALDISEENLRQNSGWVTIFPRIANAQADMGDTPGAFMTLDRILEMAHQDTNDKSDSTMILQSLASSQAHVGDFTGALQTIEELPAEDSDWAFATVSWELAKRGRMFDALEYVNRISSLDTQVSALREIALIRGITGTLEDALEAIDRIPEPSLRVEVLVNLAQEQANIDNPAAGKTLETALELSAEDGIEVSEEELATIAVTRARLGELIGAQQIVQGLKNPESQTWPLWSITCRMALAGRTSEAIALAEKQSAANPKINALLGTAQGILGHLEAEDHASAKKQ